MKQIHGLVRVSIGVIALWIGACSADGATGSGTPSKPGKISGPPGAMNTSGAISGAASGSGGHGASISNGGGSPGTSGTPQVGNVGASAPGGMLPPGMGSAMGAAGMPAAAGSGAAGSSSKGVPLTPKGDNCLQPGNGNYMAPGPYQVAKMDVDLGMIEASQHTGKFTIYYPNPLDTACLHPIVAWGNGTGVTDSDFTYDFLNSNAASWGMVVASSSEDNTGSGNFHKAGLDYLLAQNEDASSMFFHKLSTRAGVSGHSQGGFGANVGAGHPNVQAAVVEGASFISDSRVSGLTMTGTDDLGVGAADGVASAGGPMFVVVWQGGNHVGTETVLGFLGLDTTSGDAAVSQKGSVQFQRLYAAWFRCFLADDQTACALFSGGAPDACGICKDPGWAKLASANM